MSRTLKAVSAMERRMWGHRSAVFMFVLMAVMVAPGVGQDLTGMTKSRVTMAPADLTTVQRGKSSTVELQFRVEPGFHINSHEPKSSFLIPTALQLDPPSDLVISKVNYPAGEDKSFPFSPDEKLNVYTGDFMVSLAVRCLHTATPGRYNIHGILKYQACDDRACYPQKQLPVTFEVKVAKAVRPPRPNPRQSPI